MLVSTNVAAFNPWPVSLDYRKAFSVSIISADGSTDEWAMPKEVAYMRLEGAKENTNVAGVTLDRHSDFPVVLGERVPDDVIIRALEDNAKAAEAPCSISARTGSAGWRTGAADPDRGQADARRRQTACGHPGDLHW